MDIKIDNFYGFRDFHLNMSYPKKIVDSPIDFEYLENRTNFRYKKVNILMGGNATGKTTLGKLLNRFASYSDDERFDRLTDVICDPSKEAFLCIDFVSNLNRLNRFSMIVTPRTGDAYSSENIESKTSFVEIGLRDSYETCAKKLDNSLGFDTCMKDINTGGWSFSYPDDIYVYYEAIEKDRNYLLVLESILKTLDPSIKGVKKVDVVENTYAILLPNQSVIVKDGKLLNADILSSGTKAGLEISYVIASLLCNRHSLYYCDELFSYVNSDVEKACLSIIIERLAGRKQLFFTTHNTDILDMQLPKHSFTFFKKEFREGNISTVCVNAADYLKRNTDSLKHAVENDLFSTAPELDKLFEILNMQCT